DMVDGVRRVDGVDGVVDGRPQDRQGAGRLGVPLATQSLHFHEAVIPLEDEVGRQQAPVLQRLDAERTLLLDSHGEIPFGPRTDERDSGAGARTGRRAMPGRRGARWAVRTPPAACFNGTINAPIRGWAVHAERQTYAGSPPAEIRSPQGIAIRVRVA